MAFSIKAWINKGEAGTPTPLSAGAMKDLETRLSAYTESFANGLTGALSVTTAKIAEGAVTTFKIANEAVETAKIKGEAVTTAKIANSAVTNEKIATSTIKDEKLEKRIIAGAVNAEGTLLSGSGFTSTKIASGVYTIALTSELTTVGVISVNQVIGSAPAVIVVSAASKKEFTLEAYKAYSETQEKMNTPFVFIIKGT